MEDFAQCLQNDRKRGVIASDLEELCRALALLPQGRALVGIDARHQQGASRTLAKPRGKEGGSADLFGDEVFELIGVKHKQISARRLADGVGNAHDDAIVARDGGAIDAQPFPDASTNGQRPRRVHGTAVRRVQDQTPITDIVFATLDGQRLVGG